MSAVSMDELGLSEQELRELQVREQTLLEDTGGHCPIRLSVCSSLVLRAGVHLVVAV